MAIMKSGWMITAKFDENQHFVFFYEYDSDNDRNYDATLEDALERFYHADYPNGFEDEVYFPMVVQMVGIPDNDGMIEIEHHLMFDLLKFRQYFDKGYILNEDGEKETWKFSDFLHEITNTAKPEGQKAWVFLASQTNDGEVEDPIVRVFDNKAAALRHLDMFVNGNEGEREHAKKKGWEIDVDEPTMFRADEHDRYNFNHTEVQVLEQYIHMEDFIG